MRERLAKWLRKAANAVHADSAVEDEPKREGLHKMFVTPSQVPEMPNHSAFPMVDDVQAATTGSPGVFVRQWMPGDWGSCSPGDGGGTYL